jgi:hypothetical protein
MTDDLGVYAVLALVMAVMAVAVARLFIPAAEGIYSGLGLLP